MGGGRTDRRLDEAGLRHLLEWCQDGVVSRQQIRQLGGTDADIARVVRRRELRVVHPGVYADHTGPLTWQQRAWAAVLFYWPAALAGASALRDPPLTGPIHVAVDLRRTVKPVPGVLARRTADFSRWVRWQTSPPRVVLEHAVIDLVAATGDQFEKYRILATACQSRETWPQAIATALASRRRVAGRAFLRELLRDLGTGACSVLEREYLHLERRHGLPVEGRRQTETTVAGRSAYRDVDHSDYGLIVELDGRAFHDNPKARDRDLERDLDTVVLSSTTTVRLGYGQVFRHGCRTVGKIACLLERGGWPGPFRLCPHCPPRGT